MEKRGLSGVVTTLMIVAVSVVAVGVLSVVVMNLLNVDTSLEIGEYEMSVTVFNGFAYITLNELDIFDSVLASPSESFVKKVYIENEGYEVEFYRQDNGEFLGELDLIKKGILNYEEELDFQLEGSEIISRGKIIPRGSLSGCNPGNDSLDGNCSSSCEKLFKRNYEGWADAGKKCKGHSNDNRMYEFEVYRNKVRILDVSSSGRRYCTCSSYYLNNKVAVNKTNGCVCEGGAKRDGILGLFNFEHPYFSGDFNHIYTPSEGSNLGVGEYWTYYFPQNEEKCCHEIEEGYFCDENSEHYCCHSNIDSDKSWMIDKWFNSEGQGEEGIENAKRAGRSIDIYDKKAYIYFKTGLTRDRVKYYINFNNRDLSFSYFKFYLSHPSQHCSQSVGWISDVDSNMGITYFNQNNDKEMLVIMNDTESNSQCNGKINLANTYNNNEEWGYYVNEMGRDIENFYGSIDEGLFPDDSYMLALLYNSTTNNMSVEIKDRENNSLAREDISVIKLTNYSSPQNETTSDLTDEIILENFQNITLAHQIVSSVYPQTQELVQYSAIYYSEEELEYDRGTGECIHTCNEDNECAPNPYGQAYNYLLNSEETILDVCLKGMDSLNPRPMPNNGLSGAICNQTTRECQNCFLWGCSVSEF